MCVCVCVVCVCVYGEGGREKERGRHTDPLFAEVPSFGHLRNYIGFFFFTFKTLLLLCSHFHILVPVLCIVACNQTFVCGNSMISACFSLLSTPFVFQTYSAAFLLPNHPCASEITCVIGLAAHPMLVRFTYTQYHIFHISVNFPSDLISFHDITFKWTSVCYPTALPPPPQKKKPKNKTKILLRFLLRECGYMTHWKDSIQSSFFESLNPWSVVRFVCVWFVWFVLFLFLF